MQEFLFKGTPEHMKIPHICKKLIERLVAKVLLVHQQEYINKWILYAENINSIGFNYGKKSLAKRDALNFLPFIEQILSTFI